MKFKSHADGGAFHGAMVKFFTTAPAASGGVIRDMTDILRSETADADEKHAAMETLVEAVCPGWVLAPAASGGGDHFADANKMVEQPRGWLTEDERDLVQSWERHYMQGAHYAQSPSHTNDIAAEMGKLAEVCRSLLALSSPPEVVRPGPWKSATTRKPHRHGSRSSMTSSPSATPSGSQPSTPRACRGRRWGVSDVAERLTEYLVHGGFYNPELMQHDKVRDLLVDCRSEIARLREERRWVPVGERLPEEGVEVLWWCNSDDEDRGVFVGERDRSLIAWGGHEWFIDADFTHWQPLPPGPEGNCNG